VTSSTKENVMRRLRTRLARLFADEPDPMLVPELRALRDEIEKQNELLKRQVEAAGVNQVELANFVNGVIGGKPGYKGHPNRY
jgi:hypothetical protein